MIFKHCGDVTYVLGNKLCLALIRVLREKGKARREERCIELKEEDIMLKMSILSLSMITQSIAALK